MASTATRAGGRAVGVPYGTIVLDVRHILTLVKNLLVLGNDFR